MFDLTREFDFLMMSNLENVAFIGTVTQGGETSKDARRGNK